MKYGLFRIIIFAYLIVGCLLAASAQVFEGKDGRRLEVEVVQEPPCPLGIGVERVYLNKETPDKELITLQLQNKSTKAIRAYAMVSGGNKHPNMHTAIFPDASFVPGQKISRGVWPNSQDHYYFFFDYVLYEDGTTCGYDNHHRSIQVKDYIDSRLAAISRIRELAAAYENPQEFIAEFERLPFAGYVSFDNPGPPNPATIKSMPRRAFEHVVLQLRQMKKYRDDALSIAKQIESELPETPD